MKSRKPGKGTSVSVELQNVTAHGIWLWVKGEEFFLAFTDHPWFLEANIAQLRNVVLEHDRHLRWDDLDVDLALDSLRFPDRYPLVAR